MRVYLVTTEFVIHQCLDGHSQRVEAPAPPVGRFAGELTRAVTITEDGLPIVPRNPACRHCKRSLVTACVGCGGPSTEVRQKHYLKLWRAAHKKGAVV